MLATYSIHISKAHEENNFDVNPFDIIYILCV